jgi:hypothetical protein
VTGVQTCALPIFPSGPKADEVSGARTAALKAQGSAREAGAEENARELWTQASRLVKEGEGHDTLKAFGDVAQDRGVFNRRGGIDQCSGTDVAVENLRRVLHDGIGIDDANFRRGLDMPFFVFFDLAPQANFFRVMIINFLPNCASRVKTASISDLSALVANICSTSDLSAF